MMMAGRGWNETAAAEGGLENFPADIKSAGEKLLQCFTNPKTGVISVRGFEGVGRWKIAEYAARKSNDFHFFHVQIQVKLFGEDFNLGKAQEEIQRQLGMTTPMDRDGDDEESIDTQVATEIYKSLIQRKFLLVLGDVREDINFELIGDPNLRKLLGDDSKIVLVSPKDLKFDMAVKLEGLSMEMLREEAVDIARSPSIKGRFTPDTVLDCFFYILLFGNSRAKVDRLKWHWRAEGFIITEEGDQEEEEDEGFMMLDKVDALLTELQVRSMVECWSDNVRVPSSISQKAQALITSSKRKASTHGRFWIEEGSIPRENDQVKDIQRMSIRNIKEVLPLPQKCPKLSTLFLVGGGARNDIVLRIPDEFFEQIQGLRVLELWRLLNESLPKSASCLCNLRILTLIGCPHLQTLLSSFPIFNKLECLEVSGELDSSSSIPDNAFQHMNNLRSLHLDGMQIMSLPSSIFRLQNLWQLSLTYFKYLLRIPDELFEHLKQLRTLELQGNSKLESLPSSLSKLINLKKLILDGCFSLKMGLLCHLQKLSALEVLDLSSCRSLEDIKAVTSSIGDILPNLRKLYVSNIEAVRRLSLEGCQSLESLSVYSLKRLEVLDLSGTKLKTLPEHMDHASFLRQLDMLHMNQIRKIQWDQISTNLQVLNFSQCDTWNSSNDEERPTERVGAHIRVSNSKLLQSFSPSLKLWGSKCFSRFDICISPCQEDKQGRGKSIHLRPRRFLYGHIDSTVHKRELPRPGIHFDRCLEIRGGHRSPNSMHGVLSRTELLTLFDNAFVQRLSELGNVNIMNELKECRVERCEQMETFFEGDNEDYNILRCLRSIWMSSLPRLRSVCEGTYGKWSFALLKHIHLEYCPRLVIVFSSSIFLQSLETIEIKYCSRLEALFQGDVAMESSLQQLHTVCLWELPRLESIFHGTNLSALKKLKVRGCWMLKKLPLRAIDMSAASTSSGGGRVYVEGELEWWDRLKWEDEMIQHLINFRDPHPFTQRT